MSLHFDRRVGVAVVALAWGVIAVLVAEAVVAQQLSLEGPPVLYGAVGLVLVGALVTGRAAPTASWTNYLLYGSLALGGGVATFVFLFGQTQA